MPIDQRAEEAWVSGTPRGFKIPRVYTWRNVKELGLASGSGQTDVIGLSIIDRSSPRSVFRKRNEGTLDIALGTTGSALADGARGTR